MGNPLLERRAPRDWAAFAQQIEIAEKTAALPRLSEAIAADMAALDPDLDAPEWRGQQVSGTLRFDKMSGWPDLHRLSGRLECDLELVCQRCLGLCPFRLSVELDYLLGDDAEAAAAASGEEVWELDEPLFRLLDIIDEALVMALPIALRHDDENCGLAEPETAAGPEANTTRPFADLKRQMQRD